MRKLLLVLAFSSRALLAAPAPESVAALRAEDAEAPTIPRAALELGYFNPQLPGVPTVGQSPKLGTGLRVGIDWMPFVGSAGKLGLGGSLGYGKTVPVAGMSYAEIYPLELNLTYRFDFVEEQFLVPFARFGTSWTFMHEQFVPGLQRYDGWELGAGLAVNLDFIDRLSARVLKHNVGIHNTYVLAEFRRVIPRGAIQQADLGRDELRFSARIEF